MLGNEAGSQQFYAFARDLFNHGGIIQEPPASKGHQIAEFPCVHATFVLVLAAQHADQKAILGKVAT